MSGLIVRGEISDGIAMLAPSLCPLDVASGILPPPCSLPPAQKVKLPDSYRSLSEQMASGSARDLFT